MPWPRRETHHFCSWVRSGHMTSTRSKWCWEMSSLAWQPCLSEPFCERGVGVSEEQLAISAPGVAILRRDWAGDQEVGVRVVKTTFQIHISFLSAFSRLSLADCAPIGTWL